MACQHSLVAQEEQPDETSERETTRFRRFGLRFLALALAVLGMACVAFGMEPVRCTESVPQRLAWAGLLKGPVERKLKATSVVDAIVILENATKLAQEIQEGVLRMKNALAREAAPRVSRSRQRKRAEARCVLNTLAIAEQIAKVATNLKASVAVCAEDPLFQLLRGEFGRLVRGLKKWICVINIELVIIAFFSIASNLANSAVQCSVAANTSSSLNLAQQVDASCTDAGLTLVQSMVTLSASLQITIPGCSILSKGLEKQLKQGLASLGASAATFGTAALPSNMSSSERLKIIERLEKQLTPENFASSSSIANLVDPAGRAAAGAAPVAGRRLFLGGGPGAFMTMCVVDVLQALTTLALMGVTLDSIVKADCNPPTVGPVTSQALPKFLRDRIENGRRAGCGSGISNVLAKLGIAVLYLSFTSFHCTNKANLRAICGAGIAGIEASLAGVAASGAGAYLACTEGRRQKQTKYLIDKSLKAFVKEKSEELLEEVCPDLSLECFLDFTQFFQNCPNGINSSCPVAPSAKSCPGVSSCSAEFEIYGAANLGTPWFPGRTTPMQFVKLVRAIPACWEYLDCFSSHRRLGTVDLEPEVLQSHARRSLLLQKVFAADAWSATSSNTSSRGVHGLELVEQLLASMRRNGSGSSGVNGSEEERQSEVNKLIDAHLLGEELLDQASQEWRRRKRDVCSEPLADWPTPSRPYSG